MGLTGDRDFHIKTNADGVNFHDSLVIDSFNGSARFPNGFETDRILPSSDDSGGAGFHYGVPNILATYVGKSSLNLIQSRVMFAAFYVDRPTEIHGGFLAQHTAGTNANTVIRAGIFKLGLPNGNDWDIGERVIDFGTAPADQAGQKIFDLQTPVTLEKGWHASAIGTNSNGVSCRYVRISQPGQFQIAPHSSGTASDIRYVGPSGYIYSSGAQSEIENGFSVQWPLNPTIDVPISLAYGYLIFIPKWKAW